MPMYNPYQNFPLSDINSGVSMAPQKPGGPAVMPPIRTKPASDPRNDVMRNAQNRLPYSPNNGNPRGANNMPGQRNNPYQTQPMPPGFGSFDNQGQASQNEMFYQDPTGRMTFIPERYRNRMKPNQTQPTQQFSQNAYWQGGRGPGQNPYGMYPPSQGYMGGQQPYAGRYRPPMMGPGGDWQDWGGYNYNLPNAFGSYPGYGQGNPYSPYFGLDYGGIFGHDYSGIFGYGPGGG